MQTIMIHLNTGSEDYDYTKAKEIQDAIQHLFPDDEHICIQPCSVGSVQGTSWCREDVFYDLDVPDELYDIVTDEKLALLKANYSIWQTQELIDGYNQSTDRPIYMTLEPHDLELDYEYAYLKYKDNDELVVGEWTDQDGNILTDDGSVSIRVMGLFKSEDEE